MLHKVKTTTIRELNLGVENSSTFSNIQLSFTFSEAGAGVYNYRPPPRQQRRPGGAEAAVEVAERQGRRCRRRRRLRRRAGGVGWGGGEET